MIPRQPHRCHMLLISWVVALLSACTLASALLASSAHNLLVAAPNATERRLVVRPRRRLIGSNPNRQRALWIDDYVWKKAVTDGCNLLGATSVKDDQAVSFFQGKQGTIQSEFTNYPGRSHFEKT